jgi:serralysin
LNEVLVIVAEGNGMPRSSTKATAFLRKTTIDRQDPRIIRLHEILIRAYDDEIDALALAGQVGLIKADIARYPKLRNTWWSILEECAREDQLDRLVKTALRDPTSASWHVKIQAVIGAEEPGEPAAATDKSTQTVAEQRTSAMQPGVGDYAKLWEPGTTLQVRFLDGAEPLRSLVESTAKQWTEFANLKFEFNDAPDAPIRVSFKKSGSWSYIGTDSLRLAGTDEPTINFGWLSDTLNPADQQQVILHEFGHVLGLQHEHGNPASTIRWNRPEVYRSLKGAPNYWGREQVDRSLFAIWPPGYFPVHKVFDRRSIMIFPISAEWLLDHRAISKNTRLSALDRQFAAALYPSRGSVTT